MIGDSYMAREYVPFVLPKTHPMPLPTSAEVGKLTLRNPKMFPEVCIIGGLTQDYDPVVVRKLIEFFKFGKTDLVVDISGFVSSTPEELQKLGLLDGMLSALYGGNGVQYTGAERNALINAGFPEDFVDKVIAPTLKPKLEDAVEKALEYASMRHL